MYVAVRDCDDQTSRPAAGEQIYFSSRYLVLFWQGKAAIYEVISDGDGLIRSISAVNKIAGFAETSVYKQKVDIFNRSRLIKIATRLCKPPTKAVIFQGFDLHWTFVYNPDLNSVTEIEVFDISPPDPPYLVTLIKKLDNAGIFGDLSCAVYAGRTRSQETECGYYISLFSVRHWIKPSQQAQRSNWRGFGTCGM